MRWHLRLMGIALLSVGFAGPAWVHGQSPLGKVPETCGDYGTNLHFEKSPKDAAKKAAKEEKLVMVLHISGLFEDPDFT